MKNENYINIQGWMINELNLKGNELILYAIIYGFSQDGQSEFFGSVRYIAEALQISTRTSAQLIRNLLDKKFIKRVSESHYRVEKSNTLWKKVILGVEESNTLRVEESNTNKYNTNNKNTYSTPKGDAKTNSIQLLFDLYKNKGLDIPNTIFSNKTERKSADELIRLKGTEKISNMLDYCLQLVEETKPEEKRFILRFDTPYHLLKNYEAIKMKM
ncbi:MAG: helix-turn-helix domain-containing protein [Candidatus Sericytochromatia bacterium]